MVRQFALINSNNELFNLNDLNSFGYNPDGLGVSISHSYLPYGTDFIQDNIALDQNVITLNVLYSPLERNSYLKYHEFIKFLDVGHLRLRYTVPQVGVFFREVKLGEITKTEVNEWNTIDEEINLECVSAWYQWIESGSYVIPDEYGDGKIYVNDDMSNNQGHYAFAPLRLDGATYYNPDIGTYIPSDIQKWIYKYDPTHGFTGYGDTYGYIDRIIPAGSYILFDRNDASVKLKMLGYVYEVDQDRPQGSFVLVNDSIYLGVSLGSPFEIEITPINEPIDNPMWELWDNLILLQSDRYFVTIPLGYTMVVSSDPHNQRAIMVNNVTKDEINLYQYQDMTKSNFIKIPKGTTQLTLDFELQNANVVWRFKKEQVVV